MYAARVRLTEERKNWRKTHPFGFVARPAKYGDGTINIMHWVCIIPGKEGTPWEGGNYRLRITFPWNYPRVPPKCRFDPSIFHPNVFHTGVVCLSTLSPTGTWDPDMTIKQILLRIQQLLNEPNVHNPAQFEAYATYIRDRKQYEETIKKQAEEMKDNKW